MEPPARVFHQGLLPSEKAALMTVCSHAVRTVCDKALTDCTHKVEH